MSDDRISYIVQKLDKMDTRMDVMGETLVRNTVTLEEHVKRTDLLERQVANTEKHLKAEIKPLKKAYNVGVAGVGLIGLLIGALKVAKEFGLL